MPVTGQSGRLFELSKALGCKEVFDIPDGVGGRFSILTAVGLLPASILGIDIVRLLEGAAAMNERFRTAPAFSNRSQLGENPVLDYVGVCHLMEEKRGATIRVLSTWGKASGGRGAVVRPVVVGESGQERARGHAADGCEHARPALARAAASGGPPRQADHELDTPRACAATGWRSSGANWIRTS